MGLLALILSLVLDSFGPWSGRAGLRSRAREARADAPDLAGRGGVDPVVAQWAHHPFTPSVRSLIARFSEAAPEPVVGQGAAQGAGQVTGQVTGQASGPVAATAAQGRGLPVLGTVGWLAVVGVPALAVALLEWLGDAIFSPLVLVLHVVILLFTVTLGPFYRRFTEMRLLIGAGETASADLLLRRWERRSSPPTAPATAVSTATAASMATVAAGAASTTVATTGPASSAAATSEAGSSSDAGRLDDDGLDTDTDTDSDADADADADASGVDAPNRGASNFSGLDAAGADGAGVEDGLPGGMPGLERRAIAQSLLICYRDVFAPLFWYLVLPGAVGAVIVHFAQQAAVRTTGPGRALSAWLDWLPLRLIGLVFALVGKFEETVEALRAVSPIATRADLSVDPYAHQRLVLLPVAGASTGLALADAATEAELRHAAPDLELPLAEPEAGALKPAAGLLGRSAAVLIGIYILIIVLD